MALPVLALAQDVLDLVPELGITALTTPSSTDVETWLNETTGEIVSRLRGAGVTLDSVMVMTEQKTTANGEQLDEAATEWLSTIAGRGTAARVLRVRRLYDRSEDMRRQFYGDVSRIERDPGTLGIDVTADEPAALPRDRDRTRVSMEGDIW